MKKILLMILLVIPFTVLGQDISGTGWKLTDSDGDKFIILFEEDQSFTYLNVVIQSGNKGAVYNDASDTWTMRGGKITISFTNGYKICLGTINNGKNYMSGTYENKAGKSGKWSAELIAF